MISILLFLVSSNIRAEQFAAADSLSVQRSDVQVLTPSGMPVNIGSASTSGAYQLPKAWWVAVEK